MQYNHIQLFFCIIENIYQKINKNKNFISLPQQCICTFFKLAVFVIFHVILKCIYISKYVQKVFSFIRVT